LLHPLEVVVSPPKKKLRLDISLVEYDRKYLIGDSAGEKKRQRWCFRRKGVFIRRLNSGNHSWCYWYYDENGKLKKVSVSDATCREDAIIAMDAKVEEVRRKKRKVKSITFHEFAPIYLEKYAKLNKRSYRTDEKFINTQLVPYFGVLEFSEITAEDVSDFVAKRKQDGVKGSTINKHLQVLSRMFTIAEKFGYETGGNPVDRELHFTDESQYRRTRVLSHKEEARLLKEAASHLLPIVRCALFQAMRLQEILKLKVTDVAIKAGTITIRPEVNKTGKEDIIPVRSEMNKIFERLIEENGGRSEFMFNYLDPGSGEYRAIKTVKRSFREACRRAGIEGLQFRDLRRTCSTRLHEAGVDLIIQRFLRHSSFRMTGKVYIQSSMKMMRDAFGKADKEPSPYPIQDSFRTDLEHESSREERSAKVRCLFSVN
jgi:integrase